MYRHCFIFSKLNQNFACQHLIHLYVFFFIFFTFSDSFYYIKDIPETDVITKIIMIIVFILVVVSSLFLLLYYFISLRPKVSNKCFILSNILYHHDHHYCSVVIHLFYIVLFEYEKKNVNFMTFTKEFLNLHAFNTVVGIKII